MGPADRAAVIHLLSRATYGVRVEDVEEVTRIGAATWLERQLEPVAMVAQAPASATVSTEMMTRGTDARPPATATMTPGTPRRIVVFGASQSLANLVLTRLERAVHSPRQLEEVMTDFWFNHFNVQFGKGQVRLALADYEQNAIRRHVFGRFEDMLLATAQHPAMLVYLDNFMSTAPAAAQRSRRRGGLNENYARELLELHTLGIDGGYTQADVIEVARAFTGWGIARKQGPPVPVSGGNTTRSTAQLVFEFRPQLHDTGEKVVLGQTLPAGRGMEDGLEVLRLLAQRPATAEHIATKLVRHFVADEPPRALVEEVAAVFRRTGGDLRAVTRALFTASAFYDAAHRGAKTKRPFEFVASALRVTGASMQSSQALVQQLRTLRHLPYSEPAPTGYPTVADEWLSAGAMMNRMRFAIDLTEGRIRGVQFPPDAMLGAPAARRAGARRAVAPTDGGAVMDAEAIRSLATSLRHRLLPGVAADRLDAVIAADLAAQPAGDVRAITTRVTSLILGSPEFQRY